MLKQFLAENLGKVIDLSTGFNTTAGRLSLRNGFYYIYTGAEFIQLNLREVSSFGYLAEGQPYIVVCG